MLRRKLFPFLAALGATGILKAQTTQDVTGPNGEHLKCMDLDADTTICMAQDDAKDQSSKIVFHDNEPLVGVIGGQYPHDPPNLIFKLTDMPLPVNSLQLFSDGKLLIQNLDYSLKSDGTVEITEPALAPRESITAWYRNNGAIL